MRPWRLAGPASGTRVLRPETLWSDLDHVTDGQDARIRGAHLLVDNEPAARADLQARGACQAQLGPHTHGDKDDRRRHARAIGELHLAGVGVDRLEPDGGTDVDTVRFEAPCHHASELRVHRGHHLGRSSTIVVSIPRLANASAISMPTNPPPGMTAVAGFSFSTNWWI